MKGRARHVWSFLCSTYISFGFLWFTENGFHSKRNKRDSMKQNLKYIVGVGHRGLGAHTFCP